MSYVEDANLNFLLHPARVALGALLALLVPTVLLNAIFQENLTSLDRLLVLSAPTVLFVFLPLALRYVPRSESPLLRCIGLGVMSVTSVATVLVVAATGLLAPIFIVLAIFIVAPFGALGGAVFWLCVSHGDENWALTQAARGAAEAPTPPSPPGA